MIPRNEAIRHLNDLGSREIPFRFYCDFEAEKWVIQKVFDENRQLEISSQRTLSKSKRKLKKSVVAFADYKKVFDQVIHELNYGNSFLINLTFKTPIESELSLREIFDETSAKYKLLTSSFVVFSPETFIKTKDNKIYSYPMKGTIDSAIPNAAGKIKSNPKEMAEHVTIVDLIRSDLSRIASNVVVVRFRYLETIPTNEKTLFQVSTEIAGDLPANWQKDLGSILTKLLPAGSVSGAPKSQTLEIIRDIETYKRNFYTGICGKFDGKNLDCGVMIRFIMEEKGRLFYCSGGGITSLSDAESEYQEMIDKIYLPIG